MINIQGKFPQLIYENVTSLCMVRNFRPKAPLDFRIYVRRCDAEERSLPPNASGSIPCRVGNFNISLRGADLQSVFYVTKYIWVKSERILVSGTSVG